MHWICGTLEEENQRWFLGFWLEQPEGDGVSRRRMGFRVEVGGWNEFSLGHVKPKLLNPRLKMYIQKLLVQMEFKAMGGGRWGRWRYADQKDPTESESGGKVWWWRKEQGWLKVWESLSKRERGRIILKCIVFSESEHIELSWKTFFLVLRAGSFIFSVTILCILWNKPPLLE